MRVLVTGSDGFIGSHLVEELVRRGYDVRAFVMYNSFNSWGWLDKCASDVKEKFEVFQGDIRDPKWCETGDNWMRRCITFSSFDSNTLFVPLSRQLCRYKYQRHFEYSAGST